MASLQDLIKLINANNSKAFVLDEQGDIKFVILTPGDYQKLTHREPLHSNISPERVNREILKAQLAETNPSRVVAPENLPIHKIQSPLVEHKQRPQVDLRSEVIDPNFDFGKTDDDSEAIMPDFDDI